MTEYICKEVQTDNGGYLEPVEELIHCRDCKHRTHNGTCIRMMKRKSDDGYCDEGEQRKTCYDRVILK